jgi:hypothetical protein
VAGRARALHCTALNCTALHCTALHCTAGTFGRSEVSHRAEVPDWLGSRSGLDRSGRPGYCRVLDMINMLFFRSVGSRSIFWLVGSQWVGSRSIVSSLWSVVGSQVGLPDTVGLGEAREDLPPTAAARRLT